MLSVGVCYVRSTTASVLSNIVLHHVLKFYTRTKYIIINPMLIGDVGLLVVLALAYRRCVSARAALVLSVQARCERECRRRLELVVCSGQRRPPSPCTSPITWGPDRLSKAISATEIRVPFRGWINISYIYIVGTKTPNQKYNPYPK